ncbi:MAG: DMT family transporter [Rhodospirillales bacterium]|jgi:drug/metabolite transporter (DMT)-like permease|nr:DMT family transporter [Rhodospirillales bacterium]
MNAREGGTDTLKGMAFMGVSTMAVASVNAIGHHVSVEIHPFEIVFFRSMISVFVLAPVIVRRKFTPLRTRRLALLVARGLLDGASALLFFVALSLSPLAKVTALSFSAPLFATVLAILFLGEALRVRRVAALLVGGAIAGRPWAESAGPTTIKTATSRTAASSICAPSVKRLERNPRATSNTA